MTYIWHRIYKYDTELKTQKTQKDEYFVCHVEMSKYICKKRRHLFIKKLKVILRFLRNLYIYICIDLKRSKSTCKLSSYELAKVIQRTRKDSTLVSHNLFQEFFKRFYVFPEIETRKVVKLFTFIVCSCWCYIFTNTQIHTHTHIYTCICI